MKNIYRGFELSAKRERSLGGDTLLYYYVKRISDGWFLDDAFTSGEEKPYEFMPHLQARVDDYYTNPLDYYNGECVEYVIGEMLQTFTSAEIGAHFQKYAEAHKLDKEAA